MPLAPMGCEVQVHEKTDKRGTWAYHSLEGWYLYTLPEHYRVHNCHIKETKKERLSDTVQFKHKNITNPSLSPHDKIMHALAKCKATLEGMLAGKEDQQLDELKTLINNTQSHLQVKAAPSKDAATLPRVETKQSLPRVESNLPRVQPSTNGQHNVHQTQPRPRRKWPSLSHLTAQVNLPTKPPALSTRARVQAAQQPATKASQRLHQPTQSSSKKTKFANAVFESPSAKCKFMLAYAKLERDVEKALAAGVMDTETGKILQYHQLLRSPKFHRD
jgi:hypothetical protein